MQQNAKTSSNRRLARIEGQVRGVKKMIDEDRYCIDIVRQLHAVRAAITSLEHVILTDHLDTCVEHALQSDSVEQRREKVEELVAILGGKKK